jgi:hypothetical protein
MVKSGYVSAAATFVLALALASPAIAASKKSSKKDGASTAQSEMRQRQKKCGAEWREAKAAGKIEKGMKWPKYWSACNKRLKGQTS